MIFNHHLLKFGPWQEFERNFARLLLYGGWKDVKVVGRSGDGGADVLALDPYNRRWVFQCKFTSRNGVGAEAIHEVRRAGKLYEADALSVVTSQVPTRAFFNELKRLHELDLDIYHIGPEKLYEQVEKLPDYIPNRPTLRGYQENAVDAVRNALLDTGQAQLILATGLGKTVVMAEVVNDLLADELLGDGRVLVIAHTVPLVNQLLTSFWKQLPKTVSTHRLAGGEKPGNYEGITFATIQTLANMTELPIFDLVIVDEAHHLGAPEYAKTVERLEAPRILGVTATPWRADGYSIDHWLGPPVFSMGIKDGLEQGYLSDIDYRIMVDDLDWEMVRQASAFGYTIQQLNKRLLIPHRDQKAINIIRETFQQEDRKRGLVFSPSQVHAISFASDLRKNGYRAAAVVTDTPPIDRFKLISQFAAGHLDFLCVVDIFNEGIDVPDVDLLVFMRVTHSRRIFVQQLGRGLRLGDDKDKVVVLDFAADVRRVHAAMDIAAVNPDEVERLPMHHALIQFANRSMGKFFYEWIMDLGNIQDYEENDLVTLPILDPDQFDFPPEVD